MGNDCWSGCAGIEESDEIASKLSTLNVQHVMWPFFRLHKRWNLRQWLAEIDWRFMEGGHHRLCYTLIISQLAKECLQNFHPDALMGNNAVFWLLCMEAALPAIGGPAHPLPWERVVLETAGASMTLPWGTELWISRSIPLIARSSSALLGSSWMVETHTLFLYLTTRWKLNWCTSTMCL